jgi:hypothetical protein
MTPFYQMHISKNNSKTKENNFFYFVYSLVRSFINRGGLIFLNFSVANVIFVANYLNLFLFIYRVLNTIF